MDLPPITGSIDLHWELFINRVGLLLPEGLNTRAVEFRHLNYYVFDKGVAAWSRHANDEGWYSSIYFKPFGRGARNPAMIREFVYVERLTTNRKAKSACKLRSYNLAMGLPVTTGIKKKKSVEHPPGTGYCMSCKAHILMADITNVETSNGRIMIKGKCPDCGCKVQKFGRIILCPECEQTKEIDKDDYICKECRADGF